MNRRNALSLLAGIPAALLKRSALATASQQPVTGAGVAPSWTSANGVTQARLAGGGCGANSNDGLAVCGLDATFSVLYSNVDQFDGTNWTAKNTSGTNPSVYSPALAGKTASAAARAGGHGGSGAIDHVTTFDGTNWTNQSGLSFAFEAQAAGGSSTAGLFIGGYNGSATQVTYSFNGTSPTQVNNLVAARHSLGSGSSGLQSAHTVVGGQNGGALNSSEIWDGTNWSSGPTPGYSSSNGGTFGLATLLYHWSGYDGATNGVTTAHSFNGTSFQSATPLSTGKYGGMGAGTYSNGFLVCGLLTAGTATSTCAVYR